MRRLRRLSFGTMLFALAAFGQQVYPVTDDEIKAALVGVSQHASRLEPMLRQLNPADWVAKGAPQTYVTQWNQALSAIDSIKIDMTNLGQKPDQLPDELKALFRIGSYHQGLRSLMGAVRRYQNPALADLIESVAAEDQGDIDRMQQYVTELAVEKDRQLGLMNEEAQRCRGLLSKQPVKPR